MEEASIRKMLICQIPEILAAPMTCEEKKKVETQRNIYYHNVDF